jgi:hypothetical protein
MIEMWMAQLTHLCDGQERFILTLFQSGRGQQAQCLAGSLERLS